MPGVDGPGGPLDVAALDRMAHAARTHPLVDAWRYRPDGLSPRHLELVLDDVQYPDAVTAARLDVRWFEDGSYSVHYVERRSADAWQCRWDRHPKPDGPEAHFHPPPDASGAVEPSAIDAAHHLGVLFAVLDWVAERAGRLHGR